MTKRRMLGIFAHPDDEGFGSGGVLAHHAEQGVEITLVSATRGESGEISDAVPATRENLGEVREGEMRCAAHRLGISDLIFLDYRDSGMPESIDNEHSRAFIRAPKEEVVSQLVEIIRRVRPQVVLTFDPSGAYGHPDHIAIHRHAREAIEEAGDPEAYPEHGPAWRVERVFYPVIPRAFFRSIEERLEARGEDIGDFTGPGGGKPGYPDEQVDLRIDVGDAVHTKWEALHCHRTQLEVQSLFFRLPEEEMKDLMRWEYFVVGEPECEVRGIDPLFDGIEEVEETA